MSNTVVVGAQWGDEGKGRIVDLLAEQADLVCRFQGGANAGHTIKVGENEFVLHLVPSGALYPGKLCLIGNGVALDPKALLEEIRGLEKRGIRVKGRLFVSGLCHLTLPYHRLLDEAKEHARGAKKIGTTHKGIGPTYQDKMGRVGIRLADLFEPRAFGEKVRANLREKSFLLSKYYKWKGVSAESIIRSFARFRPKLKGYLADTSGMLATAITQGKSVLFEGAQGTFLDVDFGTYPFVTASNTIAGGATTGAGVGPTKIHSVLGVAKAYTTRVGAGPFPTEFPGAQAEELRRRGNEFGATTGRPRRCGWFDAVMVRHAVRVNGMDSLAITKLDVLDEMVKVKVCTGYKYKGRILRDYPMATSILEKCQPVYEELRGWHKPTRGVRNWFDLPVPARYYLEKISEQVEAKISIVSVGSGREETIWVTR